MSLYSITRKVRVFLKMSSKRRLVLIALWLMSSILRLTILLLPSRTYCGLLGNSLNNVQLSTLATSQQLTFAYRMGKLIDKVSKYTPWKSECLVQAISIALICRRYAIPYVVYLGVRKRKNEHSGDLEAHAWTCVGGNVVTGRVGHDSFVIVATFVSPLLSRLDEHGLHHVR